MAMMGGHVYTTREEIERAIVQAGRAAHWSSEHITFEIKQMRLGEITLLTCPIANSLGLTNQGVRAVVDVQNEREQRHQNSPAGAMEQLADALTNVASALKNLAEKLQEDQA